MQKRSQNDAEAIPKRCKKRAQNDAKTIPQRRKNDPKTMQKRSQNYMHA